MRRRELKAGDVYRRNDGSFIVITGFVFVSGHEMYDPEAETFGTISPYYVVKQCQLIGVNFILK